MSEPIEYRTSQLAEVDFPKRTIELIVMPYETEATIADGNQAYTEIVSRGAFDGVELRTSQIRVNRGHLVDAAVGKTVALHPSRQEGLVAELKISPTALGEETLVLADDGILDASAGFTLLRKNGRTGPVVPNAQVWETRSRRRLNHLFLHHIAMTPDPAYQDARVLAVRSGGQPESVTATPNLARLEADKLEQLYADMDRRYGLSC